MNIDIKKANGETITAELISFFEVVNIQKKYVFYTLNEVVENDLVKMYVAEVTETENELIVGQKMTEDEWTNLKSIMKSLLTGANDPNIRHIEVEGE